MKPTPQQKIGIRTTVPIMHVAKEQRGLFLDVETRNHAPSEQGVLEFCP